MIDAIAILWNILQNRINLHVIPCFAIASLLFPGQTEIFALKTMPCRRVQQSLGPLLIPTCHASSAAHLRPTDLRGPVTPPSKSPYWQAWSNITSSKALLSSQD